MCETPPEFAEIMQSLLYSRINTICRVLGQELKHKILTPAFLVRIGLMFGIHSYLASSILWDFWSYVLRSTNTLNVHTLLYHADIHRATRRGSPNPSYPSPPLRRKGKSEDCNPSINIA